MRLVLAIVVSTLQIVVVGPVHAAGSTPRHFVLLTLDTLRQDHLGAYGYDRPTSPTIDSLAKRGIRFDDAVTSAVLTPASHASILTGLNPARHGLRKLSGQELPATSRTLAEVVAEQGFETAAFVSGLPLRSETGLHRGFKVYEDSFKDQVAERSASKTNAAVMKWLETAGRPDRLFLWVHYFDPHYTYQAPRSVRRLFDTDAAKKAKKAPRVNANPGIGDPQAKLPSADQLAFGVANYDAEIRYMDDEIGRLLDALERAGILEEAVVAVVADHGESLGEHGYYFGHWDVRRETAVVPMILVHPYREDYRGRAVDQMVGTIDLMPTVASWLGLQVPPTDGIDLSRVIDGHTQTSRPIFTERYGMGLSSIRTAEWLLVRREARNGSPGADMLYDRKSNQFRENAAAQSRLGQWLEDLGTPAQQGTDGEREVPPEVKERLRALGYMP